MQARIHFARIGKKEALYIEGLVYEDERKIVTFSNVPPAYRHVWGKDAWFQKGIMTPATVVCAVRKHHFYHEWFDIIELFDCDQGLIGYYCDVITPLRKENGEFYLLDLLLDLWVFPDGRTVELDWDEFDAAARAGQISASLAQTAQSTLQRMVREVQLGTFPTQYINNPAGSGEQAPGGIQ